MLVLLHKPFKAVGTFKALPSYEQFCSVFLAKTINTNVYSLIFEEANQTISNKRHFANTSNKKNKSRTLKCKKKKTILKNSTAKLNSLRDQ